MTRLLVPALLAAGLVVAGAAPAFGHAEISGTSTFPVDSDAHLTVSVEQERGSTPHDDVKVYLPEDWTGKGCDASSPWHCSITPNALEGRTLVQWTKDAGAPKVDTVETFSLDAHTGVAGTFSVPVVQTYADGEVVRWNGPPGSEEPAPSVTVTAAATTTTAGSEATTSTTAIDPTTSTTTAADDDERNDDGDESSALPIVLVLVAVAVAGGATAVVLLRRRR